MRDGGRQSTITIVNRPESAEDVRQAVIMASHGTPVRVDDIATVHDRYEEARSYYRIDGRPAVSFAVNKEIGANTVRVADAVKARLAEIESLNPFGTRLILDNDESKEIREQLADLRTRALFSAVVIFVVLLAFLRSMRSAVLVFATIAFSVLIALNLIYFGGLTLNILTLMGLAMGFGLIVDNAIVVLENVYRRWRGGEDAPAGGRGGRARGGAADPGLHRHHAHRVRALRVPPGRAARVLRAAGDRGGAHAGGVAVRRVHVHSRAVGAGAHWRRSPRGCGGTPPSRRRPPAWASAGRTAAPASRPFYARFYADLVGFTVRWPWLAFLVRRRCSATPGYLFDKYVTTWAVFGGGFGNRTYIVLRSRLPRGSNLDRTDELVAFFEDKLSQIPEVEQYTAQITAQTGYMEITFPDSLENTQMPVAIKEQMYAYSHSFTGAEVRVYGYGPSFYGGGSARPTTRITVLGYNYERVRDIAENIGQRLMRLARVQEVDTNSGSNRFQREKASEYVVTIDRDRLARHDLTVQQLVASLNAAVAGNQSAPTLKLGGEEVQYQVKLGRQHGHGRAGARRRRSSTRRAGARIRLGRRGDGHAPRDPGPHPPGEPAVRAHA